MIEIRKDYLLNRFVIFATERAKRPQEFIQNNIEKTNTKNCPFCPGNEAMLAGIIDEIKEKGNWVVRSIKNKYPAVGTDVCSDLRTDNRFFTFAASYGNHEVIIESREHNKEIEDFSIEHIKKIIQMYIKRIKALNDLPHIKYVTLFRNKGKEAGASIAHAHSQIIAYNVLPSAVEEELLASYKYFAENESCPFCEIINIEKNSHRSVLENDSFVVFTPYASRFPFEIWIFPKRHAPSITELNEKEIDSLANVFKFIFTKLNKLNHPPYNMMFHNAEPQGENFHFHIEICPRLSIWAGFELSTGATINTITPEDAATFYRE